MSIILSVALQAQAATVVFDSDTGTSGVQESGGSFNWLSGGAVFWNSSGNVATTDNITTDIAQFGNSGTLASTATINVTTQSIAGLIFGATTTSGYSLLGNGAGQILTIGSSGIAVNAGAQSTFLGDSNLSIKLGAAQTWTNSSANSSPLTINGDVDNNGFLLTLTGPASSPIVVNGVISGSGGLTKANNANGVTLSNTNNTFTGALSILRGSLSVASLADSGTGSNGTGTINLGTAAQTGNLIYTGTGATLSRTIHLASTNTGGGTITNDGTGLLKFTSNLTFGGTTAAKTFTLQGTGSGEFAGVIGNNSGGGVTTLAKDDAGTWTLSGNNTYTGGTSIKGGTLNINTATAIGTGTLTFSGGGTLDNTSGSAITLSNNNAIALSGGSLIFTGTNNLSFGSGVLTISGANRTATINGGILTIGSINTDTTARTFTVAGTGTLVITGAAGANFQGGTLISTNSKAVLENATAVGSGAVTLVNTNAELEVGGSFSMANNLIVSDTGNNKVLRQGDGFSSTLTGTITINEATADNFDIVIGAGDVLTLSGDISGAGSIAVARNAAGDGGILVLAGNNSHTLGTLAGADITIRALTNTALGSGAVTLNNTGARLELGDAVSISNALSVVEQGNNKVLAMAAGTTSATYAGDITVAETTVGSFDVESGTGQTLLVSGAINGAAGLTKVGTGIVQLSSATNTFSGGLTVSDGTLQMTGGGIIASQNVTVTSGTFDLNGTNQSIAALTLGGGLSGTTATVTTGAGTLTASGTITYTATNDPDGATISGNLALTTNNQIFAVNDSTAAAHDLTVSAIISSSASNIVKSGSGTLVLSGANTYTGGTFIRAGTIKLGASNTLPDIGFTFQNRTGGVATLDLAGNTDTIAALTLSEASTNGTQSATGAQTQVIDSVGGGLLKLGGGVTYNAGPAGEQHGTSTISAALDLNGATRTFTIGDSDQTTQEVIVSGAIQNSSGTVGLTKAGAGVLVLSGANTYNGTTTVSAGTLQLGNGGTTGSIDSSSSASVSSGATLRTNRSNTITLGQAITGAGNVEIANTGSGSTILGSASNAYTGTTTVTSGSLQVGSSATGKTGTGAVAVQNGGTILGTGVVQGSSFTAESGSTTHAGDGTAQGNYGMLTFTPASGSGSFDFQSGSSVILGINPGGTGDLLNFDGLLNGTLLFNGNLSVTASAYTPVSVDTFNLLDWANLSTITFASRYSAGSYGGYLLGNGDDNLGFDLPDISGSGYGWDISNFTTNGTITLVVVPEPSRVLLLLGGLISLFRHRRRYPII